MWRRSEFASKMGAYFAAVFLVTVLASGRSDAAENQDLFRTLANVTLDRYMDLISMPQVPSRYMVEEDQQNVSS